MMDNTIDLWFVADDGTNLILNKRYISEIDENGTFLRSISGLELGGNRRYTQLGEDGGEIVMYSRRESSSISGRFVYIPPPPEKHNIECYRIMLNDLFQQQGRLYRRVAGKIYSVEVEPTPPRWGTGENDGKNWQEFVVSFDALRPWWHSEEVEIPIPGYEPGVGDDWKYTLNYQEKLESPPRFRLWIGSAEDMNVEKIRITSIHSGIERYIEYAIEEREEFVHINCHVDYLSVENQLGENRVKDIHPDSQFFYIYPGSNLIGLQILNGEWGWISGAQSNYWSSVPNSESPFIVYGSPRHAGL